MKRLSLLLAATATLMSSNAMAALAIGTKAPDFTTRGAQAGKTFTLTLSHQLKRGPVVLYFFPKAFTPGCSAEAREFAENIDKFKAAGATVIGMSADPVDDLVAFSTKECAGKFAVASAGPAIVTGYDVALKMRPGMTDRTSYVIAPSGRVAFVHSEMNYAEHVKSTLAAVQAMKGK
ncbi:peroxiredoxin [Sphingobium sp. WCS2017Hpa-17]|uniref:peroxiredoxin n=1 Tax=Sphingobium sp. WCS2017Hpa-17 TaxID=3073638 RepID=UPI00288AD82E|nr:peroxiredoxin [Sphingobium sp. WCS2017Hpa-17]